MDEGDEEDADFINELFGNAYTNIPYALRVINPNTDYNQFVKVSGALEKGLDEDPAALGKDGVKYSNSVDFIKRELRLEWEITCSRAARKPPTGFPRKSLTTSNILRMQCGDRRPRRF